MTTTGVPLSTDPDVDVVAWQFLADASRVSFATMALLASPTAPATSTPPFPTTS